MAGNEDFAGRNIVRALLEDQAKQEERERAQGYSEDIWSLGRVADILWRHSEMARPLIKREVDLAFDEAITGDEMPFPVSGYNLLLDYWGDILKPLFDSYPDSAETICNELQFIEFVTPYSGPDDREYVNEAFTDQIILRLSREPYSEILSECCKPIAQRISRYLES